MAVNVEIQGNTASNAVGHHVLFENGQNNGVKTVGNCRLKFMIMDPLPTRLDVGVGYVIQYVASGQVA